MPEYNSYELIASEEATQRLKSYNEDSAQFDKGEMSGWDYERDMKRLSLEFPNELFTLYIRGESFNYEGIYYAFDGRGYEEEARIVYPKFKKKNLC